MAKIWKYSIVIFFIIGLFLHHEGEMMTSVMETPYMVFDLVTTVVLSACLWGGF